MCFCHVKVDQLDINLFCERSALLLSSQLNETHQKNAMSHLIKVHVPWECTMYNPNAIVSENTYLLLDWTMYKEQFFEKKMNYSAKQKQMFSPRRCKRIVSIKKIWFFNQNVCCFYRRTYLDSTSPHDCLNWQAGKKTIVPVVRLKRVFNSQIIFTHYICMYNHYFLGSGIHMTLLKTKMFLLVLVLPVMCRFTCL